MTTRTVALSLPLDSLQWLEDWTPSHADEDGPPLTIPEKIAIAVTLVRAYDSRMKARARRAKAARPEIG